METLPKATIIRERRSDHGTEGSFHFPGFSCFTIELPWFDNRNNISCIPPGEYLTKLVTTPKHGLCFMLQGVKGRFTILIHSGNFAGDVLKGFRTHSQGCLLLGRYRGIMQGQRAVLYSRPTVLSMMDAVGRQDFMLTIKDPFLKETA